MLYKLGSLPCHFLVIAAAAVILFANVVIRDVCDCDKEGPGTPNLLRDAYCYDDPAHILQCPHEVYRDANPDHTQDLVVECCKWS